MGNCFSSPDATKQSVEGLKAKLPGTGAGGQDMVKVPATGATPAANHTAPATGGAGGIQGKPEQEVEPKVLYPSLVDPNDRTLQKSTQTQANVSGIEGGSGAPLSNAGNRPFSTAVDNAITVVDYQAVFDAPADIFHENHMELKTGCDRYPKRDNGNRKTLQQNKRNLLCAADGAGANETEKAIILAIAMSETNHIDGFELDPTKIGDARNVTCLNLNGKMLKDAGWLEKPDVPSDPDYYLPEIVIYLIKWLRGKVRTSNSNVTSHVRDALNFIRGGVTAFADNGKFIDINKRPSDAEVYRNAIASICRELLERPRNSMYNDEENIEPDPSKNQYHDSRDLWANNTRLWVDVPHV